MQAIVEQLHEVVLRLTGSGEPITTEVVVELAAFAIPHAHHCGLTLLRPGHQPSTIAASDDLPQEVDELQYRLDEGPCLDCVRTGQVINVPDIAVVSARWPRFAPAVIESGFTSVHALPMRLRGVVKRTRASPIN